MDVSAQSNSDGGEFGCSPPLAIGGLGGSGTRLVATITQAAGFHLGSDLNGAIDNLRFSLLFKRTEWYRRFPSDAEIADTIRLFLKVSHEAAGDTLTEADAQLLRTLAQSPQAVGAKKVLVRWPQLRASGTRWGWKEPNTHIFLPWLCEAIPSMKYVHVLRNGYDMALSNNQNQLLNWGAVLLGDRASDDRDLLLRSLDFWIEANRRALETGRARLGANLFVMNYDRLCDDPVSVLEKYLEFLGAPAEFERLLPMITPGAIGRHRDIDLDVFSREQRQMVEDLERAC